MFVASRSSVARALVVASGTLLILALSARPALAQQQPHQQQIEPAYLQQYYAQVAQSAGAQSADATPIVEQTPADAHQQQYYVSPQQAQQIRVKDAVAQQVSKRV